MPLVYFILFRLCYLCIFFFTLYRSRRWLIIGERVRAEVSGSVREGVHDAPIRGQRKPRQSLQQSCLFFRWRVRPSLSYWIMCFKLLIYWFVLVFIVRTWRTASELFVFLRDSQQQAVSDQEPVEKKHNSSSEFTALPVGGGKNKKTAGGRGRRDQWRPRA